MSDEPKLECVWPGTLPLVDVVLVHGLTGDARETWENGSETGFWPEWLGEDLGKVSVYTLGYPASIFEKWAKKEMDIFERASNTLERLAGVGIGERPIAFVSHSLGGILTKIILRKATEGDDEDWRRVSESTKLVVFLSTPHTGAAIANVVDALPLASKSIKVLANEAGFLEDLNEHYRSFVNSREDITTAVYYEKHRTNAVLVVSRQSADPGVGGVPVPVDKNHGEICKPADQGDIIYLGVKRHVQKVVNAAARSNSGALGLAQGEEYAERSTRDRRDLLEKLIDADREHEYGVANDYQNRFARAYTRTGLLAAAREDHDILLSELESRFVMHVYLPLICKSASDEAIREAVQKDVIDALANRPMGGTRFKATTVLSALYFLTEQCHIRWDAPE